MSLSFPAVTHQGLLTFLALVSLVAQQLLASRRHPELPLLLPGLNPLFLGSISCCILVDFFLLLSDFSNVLKKDMEVWGWGGGRKQRVGVEGQYSWVLAYMKWLYFLFNSMYTPAYWILGSNLFLSTWKLLLHCYLSSRLLMRCIMLNWYLFFFL